MTHKEALLDQSTGLPPDPCAGELELMDRFDDTEPGREKGPPKAHVLEVYRCALCGAFVSRHDGRTVNAYVLPPENPHSRPLPRPSEMARELAESFRGRVTGMMPGPGRE